MERLLGLSIVLVMIRVLHPQMAFFLDDADRDLASSAEDELRC